MKRFPPFLPKLLRTALCLNLVNCGEQGPPPSPQHEETLSAEQAAQSSSTVPVFVGGNAHGGAFAYHSYRIPSIVKATNGDLVAFAEGRRWDAGDNGDIEIVMRRSSDHGATWSTLRVAMDAGTDTIGNPTAVVDSTTGRIWLFASWNAAATTYSGCTTNGCRKVYSSYSTDQGVTWSPKVLMTGLLPPTARWDAVGPGSGIQLTSGRLVLPAKGRNIISDDNGATWSFQPVYNTVPDESSIIATPTGLRRFDRPTNSTAPTDRTLTSVSQDNGATWSAWAGLVDIQDPQCNSSAYQYNTDWPARTVFLNPETSTSPRAPMVVKISYDHGATWPVARELDADVGGYSNMTRTGDYHIAALREEWNGGHIAIMLRKFNMAWALKGTGEAVENFDNGVLDPSWTKTELGGGTVVEGGGRLRMTNAANVAGTSEARFASPVLNHYNKTTFVEFVQRSSVAGASSIFGIQQDIDNYVMMFVDGGGTFKVDKKVAGAKTTLYSGTFNATVMRWVRFREKGGTTFVERAEVATGPWTPIVSLPTLAFTDNVRAYLGHASWSAVAQSTTIYDNLNTSF